MSFKQSNYYMANLFNDRIFFTSFAYSQSNDQLNVTTLNEDATSVIKYSILGSKQYSFMNLVNYYGRIMINYRESGASSTELGLVDDLSDEPKIEKVEGVSPMLFQDT